MIILKFKLQIILCALLLMLPVAICQQEQPQSAPKGVHEALREILQLEPAISSWQPYAAWKKQMSEFFKTKPSLVSQWADLFNLAAAALNEANIASHPHDALYPYNFLRELLGLPTVSSLEHVDKLWFKQVGREIQIFTLIEFYPGWELPTEAQKELILEGARLLKLRQEIVALSHPTGASTTNLEQAIVGICKTPDLGVRLVTLYHELGHVLHNDSQTLGNILAHKQDPVTVVNDTDFKADLEDLKKYSMLALEALPSFKNTAAGSLITEAMSLPRVQQIIKEYGMLWIPPENQQKKDMMILRRGQEQRADLFALRQLLKLQNISAILSNLYVVQMNSYIKGSTPWAYKKETAEGQYWFFTEGTADKHGSNVEVTLYTIGFLIHHGFNVPQLLDEWEKQGVCLSGEQATSYAKLFTPAWGSQTESAVKKAYHKWQEVKISKEYSEWKNKNSWLLKVPSSVAYASLKSDIDEHLQKLEENPSSLVELKEALFSYNYLREIMQLPIVVSWRDIDQNWVKGLAYPIWKKDEQESWQQRALSKDAQKTELIKNTLHELAYLKKHPNEDQKLALFSYNLLREMLGLPRASSWLTIDQPWLEDQASKIKEEPASYNLPHREDSNDKEA